MKKFSVGHLSDCGGRAMEVYQASDVDARIAEHATAWKAQARRIVELDLEAKILRDEITDLRGFIDGMKRHVKAAAAMYGL